MDFIVTYRGGRTDLIKSKNSKDAQKIIRDLGRMKEIVAVVNYKIPKRVSDYDALDNRRVPISALVKPETKAAIAQEAVDKGVSMSSIIAKKLGKEND